MPRVLRNHTLPFPPVPAHACCEDEDLCGALFFPPAPLSGMSCNANILQFNNKSAHFKVCSSSYLDLLAQKFSQRYQINQSVLVRRYDPASVSWSASVLGQVRRSRIVPVSVSATPNPSRVPSFIFQFLQSGWFGRIYTVDITCPHCGEEVSDNFAAYHGEIMDPDTNPFSMPHKVIPCLVSSRPHQETYTFILPDSRLCTYPRRNARLDSIDSNLGSFHSPLIQNASWASSDLRDNGPSFTHRPGMFGLGNLPLRATDGQSPHMVRRCRFRRWWGHGSVVL